MEPLRAVGYRKIHEEKYKKNINNFYTLTDQRWRFELINAFIWLYCLVLHTLACNYLTNCFTTKLFVLISVRSVANLVNWLDKYKNNKKICKGKKWKKKWKSNTSIHIIYIYICNKLFNSIFQIGSERSSMAFTLQANV